MNIIRGILIALLVAGLTLFSVANSQIVRINLGFVELDVWLPLVVLTAFAIGFLPVWLRLSADRLLLKRKVGKLETALGETQSELSQAKVELLRPPAAQPTQQTAPDAPPRPAAVPQPQAIPQPAPPPGT